MKDVVIVGAGPVGLFAALLLEHQGIEVDIYERWPTFYPLPRACGVDHEIIRLLQGLDMMAELEPLLDPVIGPGKNYEFFDSDGETILKIDWNRPGASGWAQMNMFYQPDFEAMMVRRLEKSPRVRIHRGHELVAVEQSADLASLEFADPDNPQHRTKVQARYVIGADGGRSTVRELLGIAHIDLGFEYDWLVVDVVPHEERVWQPYVIQHCDPARPKTLVGSGPKRRRWEFMRLPGESIEELNTTETAWKLLAPSDITPDNATLERHAVYTFRGSWTDQWKQGRVLLAGDAAHLMPPFLGQGLCSGMRDSMALSWRLAAIINQDAPEALLDSYGPERREHVCEIIRQAVEIGRLICMLDPLEVAERNARMKAAMKDPTLGLKPPPEPRLGYAGGYRITDGQAGLLSAQGRVEHDGCTGLFDDVAGAGWQLLLRSEDGPAVLDPATQETVQQMGIIVADFGSHGSTVDLDGIYGTWFDRLGAEAVLVRPDFYVFGTSSLAEVGALIAAGGAMLGISAREVEPADS